ncbi:MAG TPA: DUF3078 domain-containing protein [Chitinophagaceae bacterium]|nr:DUF3078 domain-containing protein [Chitinophagaceae bacterium]
MKKTILVFFCFSSMCLMAQDQEIKSLKTNTERSILKDPNDTLPKLWKKGGIIGVNLSQGSLSHWASGGDKFSLALNSVIGLHAFYKKGKNSWDNSFDFNFGYVKTTSLGSRKNDDRIDLLSKYGHAISPKWSTALLFNFRSQFFKGYTYDENGIGTLSSSFLSPAYVLVSLGLDWKPCSPFSMFLSPISARWVIVAKDELALAGAYGVDPGKHSKNEIGAFVSLNYFKETTKSLVYKGRLDLFSNYKHNPQKIDVYMTNVLNVKLSKSLALTYSLDMIYDDDVRIFGDNHDRPALQIKSLIGVGLLLRF